MLSYDSKFSQIFGSNALANVDRHEAHIFFASYLLQKRELNSGAILGVASGMFPLGELHRHSLHDL